MNGLTDRYQAKNSITRFEEDPTMKNMILIFLIIIFSYPTMAQEEVLFSGEIESDFPLTVESTGRRRRHKLSGVHGDGSAFIEATTFSGDVTVQKR